MPVSNSSSYKAALVEAAEDLIGRGRKVFGISSDKIPFPNCEDCKGQTSSDHRDSCACMRIPTTRCHGFYAATDDLDVIKVWIDETPDMHLAVATGQPSGIFVLEYDPKNGGDVSYQELIAQYGAFDTETNMSPSGGLHFIFNLPNFDVSNIHGKLWPGIDVKGTGGYHLVPPSKDNKGQYTHVNTRDADDAPKFLRDAIFQHQSRNKWADGSRTLRPVERKDYDPESISEELSDQVRKTVDYWTGRIRSVPVDGGNQNTLIYTASRVMYSLCYVGLLDDDYAQDVLEQACAEGNHPEHRSLLAIDSGRRAAADNPDPTEEALSDDRDVLETFQLDDIGNANRVVFWKGTDLRYDPDREKFYSWDKKKWIPARDGRVMGLVEDVITKIPSTEANFYSNSSCPPNQVQATNPKTYRQTFLDWAAKQRFSGKITSTALLLKGREAMWCTSDDFDIDPYHFNVNNGVIDLRTGDLKPHTRSFMCSNISKVDYDPEATCPEWERFLEMTQPDPEHRLYLQRLMGYTLIGEVRDQIFAIHIGSGGNGKGVALDTFSYVLNEYACTGQRDSFVRKSNSNRIPADIASFEGKRFVVVDELNDNQKMDTALLKDITGGGAIKAESKNVNPWEYTPKFTLHFRTNHLPDLPSDRSIVRRFRPVRWSVEPTADQWDTFTSPHHSTPTNYLTKRESSGILNWILAGTRDYLQNGLQVPIDLEFDATAMLEENDPFLSFMSQCVTPQRGHNEAGTRLYKAFKEWYDDNHATGRPPSAKSLWIDVREGKYKDRWEWDMERQRMMFLNIQIDNMLTLR